MQVFHHRLKRLTAQHGIRNQIDRQVLASIAQQSGGSAIYAPSAVDLARAYRTLPEDGSPVSLAAGDTVIAGNCVYRFQPA